MLIGIWSTRTNKLVLQLDDKDPWTPKLLLLMKSYERKQEVFIRDGIAPQTKLSDCACACCVDWGCKKGCACFPKSLPPDNSMEIH